MFYRCSFEASACLQLPKNATEVLLTVQGVLEDSNEFTGCIRGQRRLFRLCQVVPEDKREAWMSGRCSAASGLVGDDTLLVLGGQGHGSRGVPNMLANFTIKRRLALAIHASLGRHNGAQLHRLKSGM